MGQLPRDRLKIIHIGMRNRSTHHSTLARVLAACLSLKRQNTRVKGTINITMESPNVTGSPLSFSTTHPPLSQRTQTLNKPPHQSGKGRSNKFDPARAL